tara:strand:- start:229 stop:1008 length:780 start_codon:yes stop_codon:yes gene_type:complete
MEIIKDQLGRSVQLDQPSRIVSLVPSQTELLVYLGLENKLLGVTKFCVFPEHLRKEKVVVGGTKKIDIDKIRQLKPDIILCNKEENTQEIVSACEAIAPTHVSEVKTLEEAYEMMTQYGLIFNQVEKAQNLLNELKIKEKQFKKHISSKCPKKVAYMIWRSPWMVAGHNNFINSLLKLMKLENMFSNRESRYPEIELNELQDADLILLSSEPFPFKKKHIAEIRKYTNAQIVLVNGTYFSWYGSRLLQSYDYFMQQRFF